MVSPFSKRPPSIVGGGAAVEAVKEVPDATQAWIIFQIFKDASIRRPGIYLVYASSGPIKITLPDLDQTMFPITIKKMDNSTNSVTIYPRGTTKIEGDASLAISTQWGYYTLKAGKDIWLKI